MNPRMEILQQLELCHEENHITTSNSSIGMAIEFALSFLESGGQSSIFVFSIVAVPEHSLEDSCGLAKMEELEGE